MKNFALMFSISAMASVGFPLASPAHELGDYRHRPNLSSQDRDHIVYFLKLEGRDQFGDFVSPPISECMTSLGWVGGIYDRLVRAAGLEETVQRFPKLIYSVMCNANDLASMNTDLGRIYVPAGAIRAAESEDEVAFMLAHELAHFSMGHDLQHYIAGGAYDPELEHKADMIGLEFIVDAGYDSGAALRILSRLENTAGRFDASESHGTARDRLTRLESEIRIHSYLKTRPTLGRLHLAKHELSRMSKR